VLHFRFDGRTFSGLQGDTLASALLANGVHLIGRSFKYHRPRGVLASGAEEPSALVTVRRDGARVTPNLRATQVELYEGLDAISQNRWPALAFDVGAINDLFAPFIPAGFYYKTFMWPKRAWHAIYEPRIRAAAGLGRTPKPRTRSCHALAHCDVLVGRRTCRLSPEAVDAAHAPSCATSGADGRLAAVGAGRRRRAHASSRNACRPGRPAARDALTPHHRLRLLPAQPARPERTPHRSPARPA
jgi:hypothetical protein